MSASNVKTASTDHPVIPAIAERFSPYAYDGKPVDRGQALSCFEAARWAASSYNEQPWSFIVAFREDGAAFEKMLECLLEANQAWAKHAGMLMITVVVRTFSRNGKPNRVAEHDLGLAMGNFSIQATTLGLHVHQMAGINPTKARQTYNVPDGFDPITAVAVGHAADPGTFGNADLADRDRAARSRKPLTDFVFQDAWSRTASILGS